MALGDERHDVDLVEDVIYALRQGGSIDNIARNLYDGNRYTAGTLFTDISDSTAVNMLLQNPADSGITLVTTTQRVGSDGAVELTNIKNVTASDAGTSVDEVNRRTSSSDSSIANASHTSTYSDGTPLPAQHSGGGGSPGAKIGAVTDGPSFLIDEGDNILASAVNRSGGSSRITMSVTWSEIPTDEVDEIV